MVRPPRYALLVCVTALVLIVRPISLDAEIVRPNHDLTYQLTARKERLSWLIRFINDNGALAKVSVMFDLLVITMECFAGAPVNVGTDSYDLSRCLKEVVNAWRPTLKSSMHATNFGSD